MPTSTRELITDPLAPVGGNLKAEAKAAQTAGLAGDGPKTGPKTLAQKAVHAFATAKETLSPEQQPEEKKSYSYEDQLQMLMGGNQPETAQEAAARAKKESRDRKLAAVGDALAAVGNMIYAPQSGYSNYDSKNTATGKMLARQEQLRRERQQNNDLWMRAYSQMQQNLRHKEDIDFRSKQFDAQQQRQAEQDALAREQFNWRKEQADKDRELQEKQFGLKQTEADRDYELRRRQVNIQAANVADRRKDDYVSFMVDGEQVDIPKTSLNTQTLNKAFSSLPKEVRDAAVERYGTQATNALGMPATDAAGKPLYAPLTNDQILQVFGEYADEAGDAIYALAKKTRPQSKKPKLF